MPLISIASLGFGLLFLMMSNPEKNVYIYIYIYIYIYVDIIYIRIYTVDIYALNLFIEHSREH